MAVHRLAERNRPVQRKIVVRDARVHRTIEELLNIGSANFIAPVDAVHHNLKAFLRKTELIEQIDRLARQVEAG